jgi:RNA polymerase primary sigma factor
MLNVGAVSVPPSVMPRTTTEHPKTSEQLPADDVLPDDLFLPADAQADDEDAEAEVDLEIDVEESGQPDAVGAYLREIGRSPLLKPEEEVDLSQRIEAGDEAARRLRSGRIRSARTRAELEAAVRDGDDARERMIRQNLRLVVSIARRYRATGMPFLDLIQEGNLGLIRAVEKFDWRRGYKFSTYATWWIRQAVQRGIADRGRVIRLPVHVHDMLLRMRKARGELEGSLGREASDEEIATGSKISARRVQDLQRLNAAPLSLETPMGEGSTNLGELVRDPSADEHFEEVFRDIQRSDMLRVLDTLNERERVILQLRFGMTGEQPLTLEEVGRRFGLTRERIRQLEGKALAKLRHPSRSAALLELG